ncbi:50S ribosomal protein L30 [Flammeovirgaceae bacterium 311]|nr:50S ribosomal protein L30 [Flammeovirgaceae bacterium 311]
MAKLIITKVKSTIKRPAKQKATMQALGLKKMNQTVEHEGTPQILGMIKKVQHLVSYKEA